MNTNEIYEEQTVPLYRSIYITKNGDIKRIVCEKPIAGSYKGKCRYILVEKIKNGQITLSLKRLNKELTPICKIYYDEVREYNTKLEENLIYNLSDICEQFLKNVDSLPLDSTIAKNFAYQTYIYSYSSEFHE
ncbi:MAG: hypothetical protein PHP54_04585 [Clostridia bacterium]|nr:hypothetical protein [Clostridia bacterium]